MSYRYVFGNHKPIQSIDLTGCRRFEAYNVVFPIQGINFKSVEDFTVRFNINLSLFGVDFSKIKILSISGLSFQKEIVDFSRIKTLNITNNHFEKDACLLWKIDSLEHLILDLNSLRHISKLDLSKVKKIEITNLECGCNFISRLCKNCGIIKNDEGIVKKIIKNHKTIFTIKNKSDLVILDKLFNFGLKVFFNIIKMTFSQNLNYGNAVCPSCRRQSYRIEEIYEEYNTDMIKDKKNFFKRNSKMCCNVCKHFYKLKKF